MGKGSVLGEFEQIVLLAVARLEGEGYGVTIRKEIEAQAEREVTIGAVYATLSRLEEKGLLVPNESRERRAEGQAAPRRSYR